MSMPTLLIVRNLIFVIHTRDHGFPHVTIYQGRPDKYEAMAKVRLDNQTVLEVIHFSRKDMNLILKITARYQKDWMEVWNEIFEGR
jgi:hypothetical protein